MIAKYAALMYSMKQMAEDLEAEAHLFAKDKRTSIAIGEAVRALKGSAEQVRSAEKEHSNEPNPLTTTKR